MLQQTPARLSIAKFKIQIPTNHDLNGEEIKDSFYEPLSQGAAQYQVTRKEIALIKWRGYS